MEPRIAVYTAITNDYDILRTPTSAISFHKDPNISYFCFTDNPIWMNIINDTVWKIVKIPKNDNLDDVRKARQVKILFHKFLEIEKYDYSVWIDGNINIIGHLPLLISKIQHSSLIGFKHPFRTCIYDEGNECINQNKDDPHIIKKQLKKYLSEGYPSDNGLTETNVLIRKHGDQRIVNLMEAWWEEVKTFSRRDQLSFCYASWKTGIPYDTMNDYNARGTSDFFSMHDKGSHNTQSKSKIKIFFNKKLKIDIDKISLLFKKQPTNFQFNLVNQKASNFRFIKNMKNIQLSLIPSEQKIAMRDLLELLNKNDIRVFSIKHPEVQDPHMNITIFHMEGKQYIKIFLHKNGITNFNLN